MAPDLIPPEGPPPNITVGDITYDIASFGASLDTQYPSKEFISKWLITWHHVTWVYRPNSSGGYVAYPLLFCHRGAVQTFLSPEVAAELDKLTAEKASIDTTELDREETKTLHTSAGVDLKVKCFPTSLELAPVGFKPPVFKKGGKDSDDDSDSDSPAPTKKKGKNTNTKKGSSHVKCAWFLGHLKHTSDWRWESSVMSFGTPATPKPTGGAASTPQKKASVQQKQKTPITSGHKSKFKAAPASPAPVTKQPPQAPAKRPAVVMMDDDMFAKPAAKKQVMMTSNGAKASAPAPRAKTQNGDETMFVLKTNNHAENMRIIMSYLASCPDAPTETRALVKHFTGAVRSKPGSEQSNVFRVLALSPGNWNLEGLQRAVNGMSDLEEQKKIKASYTAMRSVFAEMLAVRPSAPSVNEW